MKSVLYLAFAITLCPASAAFSSEEAAASGEEQLTLEQAIAKSMISSPRVKQAEAERNSQAERHNASLSDLGPRVKAEYTYAKFDDSIKAQLGSQLVTIRPEVSQTGAITVLQPLTGIFALAEKAKFEGSQKDAKDAGLEIARSDTALQTAEIWLKAYLSNSQLDIALASVKAAESQLRDATALERAGRMNRGDVLKLELAVSEAKARLALAQATAEVVLAGLKVAIGLTPDANIIIAKELPKIPSDDPTLVAATDDAAKKRLEPRLAKGGIAAASFGKKVAYTNFAPSINAFAKWDHNFGEPAGLGGGGHDTTRTYGIQASWEIWNNGAHIYAVREAVDNIEKAEENARSVDIQIRLEVTTALANLKASRESLVLAESAINQAAESYRIEQARFRSGSRSATDLILAETSNANAKGRLVLAQTDLISWFFRLNKARGEMPPTFK